MVRLQVVSMWVAMFIVASHCALMAYFLFLFDVPQGASIQEIATPLTVAYVSAVVMWLFRTKGLITSDELIGYPLVFAIVAIVGVMVIVLFAIPISFQVNNEMSIDALNGRFLYVETAFGGVFGIVMTELFGFTGGADDKPG